jgi:membrane protein DedA with SNARE-associated domain
MPITTTPDPPDHEHSNPLGDIRAEIAEEARELREDLGEAYGEVRHDVETSRAGRWAVAAFAWLFDHAPKSRRGRVIAYVLAFLLVVVPATALLIATFTLNREDTERWFSALGYPGVFLANLLSTATVFLPVPGLTALAQALIVREADILNPFLVGFLGGLGMGLGETTAWLTGVAGAEIARENELKAPRLIQPALNRLIRWVNWLMQNYGVATLFVLSVIPDPIFEFAGVTAGATGMGFRKFMAVVLCGNMLRGLLLAYFGPKLVPL